MTEESKKPKITYVTMVDPDIKTMFSNSVNIEVEEGAVILNFFHTLPGVEGPQKDVSGSEDVYARRMPVFARIALTNSHFSRFVKLCQNTLEGIENDASKPIPDMG